MTLSCHDKSGGGSSHEDTIGGKAHKEARMLNKSIELIGADIVILCGNIHHGGITFNINYIIICGEGGVKLEGSSPIRWLVDVNIQAEPIGNIVIAQILEILIASC